MAVVLFVTLLYAGADLFQTPKEFRAALLPYSLELAIPFLAIWAGRRPLKMHAEWIVLGCDIAFTTALLGQMLLPASTASGAALMLSLKMLATALFLAWRPRLQFFSAGVTVLLYWGALYLRSQSLDAPVMLHQVLGPFIAALFSAAGAANAERSRRTLFERSAKLASSEATLRALLDSVPDGILVAQAATIAFANPQLARILGFSAERDLEGRDLFSLIPSAEHQAVHHYLEAMAERASSSPPLDTRFLRADGTCMDVALTAARMRHRGQPAVQVMVRDVTESKRADALLRDRETRLRLLVEQMPAALWSTDTELRITSALGAGLAPLNLPANRGGAVTLFDYFGSDGRDSNPIAVHYRALQGESNSYEVEWKGRTFQSYVEPLRAPDGSITGTIGVALDVSDRKRAENQQHQEAQVATALVRVGRALISSLETPILLERLCELTTEVLDCDFCVAYRSRQSEDDFEAVSAFGLSREDWEAVRLLRTRRTAVGDLVQRLNHTDAIQVQVADYADRPSARVAMQFGVTHILNLALRRGGELFGVLMAGRRAGRAAFEPTHERIAAGMTQLASLALENARLVEELAQANRVKSDFVATMSHELRTPLNVIIGYNELLLEGIFGSLNDEQSNSLDRVGASARELLELINTTLDLSRLEAGRIGVDLDEIAVTDLVEQLNAETEAIRRKPAVAFSWAVEEQLPALVTDVVKLKVILKNLITNAMKFTEQGTVIVAARARDDGVEFSVSDTGIGISSDVRPIIFEAFHQADSSLTRRYGGVGLGLYIVRRLLELLGGAITVDSQPGAGSTFRVWIPRQPPGVAGTEQPDSTPLPRAANA